MSDEPFIRVRNLRHAFGSHEVLRGIDLDIHRGETLVLLGGSGAGKSVLLKLLPGLLCPSSGTIHIEDTEISCLNERDLAPIRQKVGMMFQGGALFDSMTVGENVAFPLREAGIRDENEIANRVEKALNIVRLNDQENKMPADLSGGMRKRVALARAVVDRPDCVLYDEPHAGLDPITADTIDHMIRDLQQNHGMTNVVVTHEMRSVFHIADRVLFLKDGTISWQGTPQELSVTKDPGLRAFIEGDSGDSWPENPVTLPRP
jgi:phospholipid/cholesterol/gamma-HCH transport system ATP-binding protein